MLLQSLLLLIVTTTMSSAEHHDLEFVVEQWVVDFLRPTVALTKAGRSAKRQTPFAIPEANRKSAILVNGQYPGPEINVYENDTVSINVVNRMISEGTSIHWHGIHPHATPWTDGAVGVTQAPIMPGENFTYSFTAWPSGTHYWHSHMDGMQSAKGLRGAFIVKEHDVSKFPVYDEDKVIVLADEWQDPDVCLKLEGAMAGNDVCSDIDYASMNGQVAWGDLQYKKQDLNAYPYPMIDVDSDSWNLNAEGVAKVITEKTRAIIVVHGFGQPADMDVIQSIADKYNLKIIIDGAQSFGSTCNNKTDSNLGDISITSFYPSKPLGCYGDGGAVFTNNNDYAKKLKMLRVHGQTERNYHKYIGIGGRMDTIQAAILLAKLEYFSQEIKDRQKIAEYYTNSLSDILQTPTIKINKT